MQPQRPAGEVLMAVAGINPPNQRMVVEDASSQAMAAARGKKRMADCFRCGRTGHCVNDCTTELCLCCQSPDHESKNCHLISAPKPSMKLYGAAHEDLMFWEFPLSGMVRPRVDNTRLSRVTISNGLLSMDEIIAHLRWIINDANYQWEVKQVERDIFRVNFPSKADLDRALYFGTYTLPDGKTTMSFDTWKKKIEPAWTIDNYWVRVYGLPAEALDDFLGLWALGDLFGKTTDIDMEFTRKTDVLRISIDCIEPSIITSRMDFRVNGQFYKLRFEVEGMIIPPSNEDVQMDEAPHDDDGGNNGNTNGNVTDNNGANVNANVQSNGQNQEGPQASNNNVNGANGVNSLSLESLQIGTMRVPLKAEKKMSWADMVEQEEREVRSAPAKFQCHKLQTLPFSAVLGVGSDVGPRQPDAMLRQSVSLRQSAAVQRQDAALSLPSLTSSPALPRQENLPFLSAALPRQENLPPVSAALPRQEPALPCQDSPPRRMPGYKRAGTPHIANQTAVLEGNTMCDGSPKNDGMINHVIHTYSRAPSAEMYNTQIKGDMQQKKGNIEIGSNNNDPRNNISKSNGSKNSDGMPPSVTNVVSFGGINEPAKSGVRSSSRIGAQLDADVPQMERAKLLAQRRNDYTNSGYSPSCALAGPMAPFAPGGSEGANGVWMQ